MAVVSKDNYEPVVPRDAPLVYKLCGVIVGHFPYRLGFLFVVYLVSCWHAHVSTLGSTLVFLLAGLAGIINTAYPVITDPLRRFLIGVTRNIFRKSYSQKIEKDKEIRLERARELHFKKYGTKRMLPFDEYMEGDNLRCG